ncbi:hypothetical protein Tco_1373324, partial [Tanacetum coccineum]
TVNALDGQIFGEEESELLWRLFYLYLDHVKRESLNKYGDTAVKCLVYSGTWKCMGNTGAPEIVAGVGSGSVDGLFSGTRANQVFSQLMINDGSYLSIWFM